MRHRIVITFVIVAVVTGTRVTEVKAARANLIDIYRKEVFDYGVLKSRKPVVVLFTSSSCTLCTSIHNRLKEFASDNGDKMYLATVDVAKKPELKEHFGITSLPTTRTYYKGQMLDEFKGPVWPSVKYISQKAVRKGSKL